MVATTVKQDQEVQEEIRRLRKSTRRSQVKPSRLLKPRQADPGKPKGKRPGTNKRSKTKCIRVDHEQILIPDTSARHQGNSAVCTHIGNELFASFSTTDSKSRLNFLRLLCQPEEQYRLCEEARECLRLAGPSGKLQAQIDLQADGIWSGREAWEAQLTEWGIDNAKHRREVSEAALFGKLLTENWYDNLGLVSDDAPQFKLFGFAHGLVSVLSSHVDAGLKLKGFFPLPGETHGSVCRF